MLLELIEKRGQPIKTRVKYSKKEYERIPFEIRVANSHKFEVHETARTIWFDVDGDLLNKQKL